MSSSQSASPKSPEFGIRLVSGIAIVVVTALFAYLGGLAFSAFVAVIIAATTVELCQLLRLAGYSVSRSTAIVAAAAAFVGIRWQLVGVIACRWYWGDLRSRRLLVRIQSGIMTYDD